MTWVRNGPKRAQRQLTATLPAALRRELDKVSTRVGRRGVRIARALVARDTGGTASRIEYYTEVSRDPRGGWVYTLTVGVSARTKAQALAAIVTEFGRGHGRAGHRARGRLPPRPYLRRSRQIVVRRAASAYRRAMRVAARDAYRAN